MNKATRAILNARKALDEACGAFAEVDIELGGVCGGPDYSALCPGDAVEGIAELAIELMNATGSILTRLDAALPGQLETLLTYEQYAKETSGREGGEDTDE